MVKDDNVAPSALLGSGLVIGGCILGILFFDRRTYPLVFVVCTALAGVAYLRTLRLLGRVAGGSNRVLALCLVLAAVWRVPLLLEPPTLSTDVYRYVWDGRIQRLGYDPYLVAPGNRKFRQLHTAETRLINHSDVPTPYPAAAELFFRAVMTVNESALAMKSAVLLCDASVVAVLFCWLQAWRRSTWWVLAYAWNPLVALEGAGNGHVDLLGALCLVLTAASLARGRRTIASIAFALGVGVKFLPATLVPLLWRRIRLRDAALGGAALAALYIPFLGHGSLPFGSLGDYLAYWRVNAPVYSALERVFPTAGLIVVPIVFRPCGRLLDALAFCPRVARGLGLACRSYAVFRTGHLSLVLSLADPVSVHFMHVPARGLDGEFTICLLVAPILDYNRGSIRHRAWSSRVDVGAIGGSASRDEIFCLRVRRSFLPRRRPERSLGQRRQI